MPMNKTITIIGLGYVGLPLALLAATKFQNCKGVDISEQRVREINDRTVTINDFFAANLLRGTSLEVSTKVETSDIYVVCVPTPVNERNEPDLSPVLSALDLIKPVLKDNQLIIVESTIYPGMCEDVIAPYLSNSHKNFLLAHCPERVNPGDPHWHVGNIPRVVGGIDDDAASMAFDFYSALIDANVKKLNSIRSAEATKVLENIFRDVNIALMNEMAQAFYRMDIDVVEVIQAASTKPFAFMPHWPGVGVGGHCIAVDPYYMIEKGRQAGFDHEFLKLARKINSNMPIYTVNLLQNALNQLGMPTQGVKVGVYGLSYKANIGDVRESPSLDVIKKLKTEKKAAVKAFDPYILSDSDVKSIDELIEWADALLVCTAHNEILEYPIQKLAKLKLVVDGRNCLDPESIKSLGVKYKGIGRN
jgi:UDP-N-acetyl-D-glucosamine dehydrogenase